MFEDCPEIASVFVITAAGQEPNRVEIDRAVKLSYLRGYKAKEMCPRMGQCVVKVCHEQLDDGDFPNSVDIYALACDDECPLLIGKEPEESGIDT
jgi:hypothetical protein